MIKCRIIKRTDVDGKISYVIQQKHKLFRWWWVDAWMNKNSVDTFPTLEEAEKNLCHFNGTKVKNEVVKTYNA